MRNKDLESRRALLQQLERSGIPAAIAYDQRISRIIEEFGGDIRRLAVEIDALRLSTSTQPRPCEDMGMQNGEIMSP
jgi:hypothetical protein